MVELSLDKLGTKGAASTSSEKDDKSNKAKRRVTNILEWVQCFALYTAVIAKKQPNRVQDLLGYQALIVDAHMEYGDQGYDRRFRQDAAAHPKAQWAHHSGRRLSTASASRIPTTSATGLLQKPRVQPSHQQCARPGTRAHLHLPHTNMFAYSAARTTRRRLRLGATIQLSNSPTVAISNSIAGSRAHTNSTHIRRATTSKHYITVFNG